MTAANRYPRFRAPLENGQVLCDPPWKMLVDWVECRTLRSDHEELKLFGISISQLSGQARKSSISAAESYTNQYLDPAITIPKNGPVIVTGHQPELFHPGVWYKNFSAARLAAARGGMAINLIIDSDLCRSSAIRVPTGNVEDPTVETVALDKLAPQMPYEERRIMDQRQWETFGNRAANTIAPIVGNPLIREWWPDMVASDSESNLGLALSQARHRLEQAWGSHSWELPQSLLCQTDAFRLFALHLFVQPNEFRIAYNSALDEYRTAHHLRNHAHPVPDLQREDEWIESPFWIWTTADPIRRPLFVRTNSEECQLTDRETFIESLPIYHDDSDPKRALGKMADWESRGIKIRTRALTTTLFVRLLLADVFIHGIGGSKYDQVTDALCRDFFDISLPPYATISGTLHLPIKRSKQKIPTGSELRQELRDLAYHPERHCEHMRFRPEDAARIEQLVSTKRKWIHAEKTPQNAGLRHEEITGANQQLQHWLSERRRNLEREIAQSQQKARVAQILNSREYSYCLFPSEVLKEFLLR